MPQVQQDIRTRLILMDSKTYTLYPFGMMAAYIQGTVRNLTTRLTLLARPSLTLSTRLLLQLPGGVSTGQRFLSTRLFLLDVFAHHKLTLTSLARSAGSSHLVGMGSVLPLYSSDTLPFFANGIILDQSPSIATAPRVLLTGNGQGLLLAGTHWILVFANPSSLVQSAFPNGVTVPCYLSFPLFSGEQAFCLTHVTSTLSDDTTTLVVDVSVATTTTISLT